MPPPEDGTPPDAITLAHYAERAYLEYALSVVKGRALPDVCDGQKPVQRRILYAMERMGLAFTTAAGPKPVKSARVVGDVLGRFHPHGDTAAYDALVRMAQDFSQRYPLIDGQGNFGSRDGDGAAAMRYTEARLAPITRLLLDEIDEGTVDFIPNYDGSTEEPRQLPARLPFVLLNGASGIAVGLATEVPSHNLREVAAAAVLLLKQDLVSDDELLAVLPGPDYPGGGQIISSPTDIREAYATGRGRIMVRAHADIEEFGSGRQRIIIHDLPFAVNKARLIERMADLVKDKKVEGISNLRDESDRNEMVRIVIEIKKEANPEVVLNQLYKNCALQDACCANMIALVPDKDGKLEPKTITLFDALKYYIEHQENVVTKRTEYDLEQALGKRHIDEGLLLAIDHIDEIINIIRASRTEADAKAKMCERFGFSDKQAQHIVDMRLGRLTGL
ncbi:MAG: DNA topoisomerase IV subunit A, partial [Aquincola sp.]|nr:DNA topoisomerase IV subunit A [Aquincola sp.]